MKRFAPWGFGKTQDAFLDRLERVFDFKVPRAHGYDVVEVDQSLRIRCQTSFLGMGVNFLSATPDTTYTAAST